MKCHIEEPTRRRDGTWSMNITSRADLGAVYDELHDKDLNCELKPYRQKRSLDANAYCWVLIGKLAENIGVTPDEVYREAIRNVGVYEVIPIKEKAVERFCAEWCRNSKGRQAETMPSKLKGFVNVMAYYSSSDFDTHEMSRLIDIIVQDCKSQGIETMSPAELQAIKDRWGEM